MNLPSNSNNNSDAQGNNPKSSGPAIPGLDVLQKLGENLGGQIAAKGEQLGEQIAAKIPDHAKTMSVLLRHLLIVSHAVPADRVRSHVPQGLELDTVKVDGQTCAILQMSAFWNENFHYTPLPKPSLDFWQMNYRVLVHAHLADAAPIAQLQKTAVRGEQGIYVFRSYLGTRASWVVQRAVASEAAYADFNVITRGIGGSAETTGDYASYIMDVAPGDGAPPTQVAVRTAPTSQMETPVAPFAARPKMVNFLTHRLQAFAQLSVGENIFLMPAEHQPMTPHNGQLIPVGAEVRDARFGVWEQMGLLTPEEMRRPYSILIQPQIEFVTQVPRPVKAVVTS